ncbi:MAG TPA: hypothetical protein VFZ53_30305 [Polyangiaceae bacterium]
MDGPVLLHAAWLFALVWIWAYRRFFETDAPRVPEFEAFCRQRPLLARLAVQEGAEREVATKLARRLCARREAVATLGAFPWTFYVLELVVTSAPGEVRLTAARCRPVRTREKTPMRLTDALLDIVEGEGDRVLDVWLIGAACVDVSGRIQAPRGWRLSAGAPRSFPCAPWSPARETAQRRRRRRRRFVSSASADDTTGGGASTSSRPCAAA